MVVSTRLLALSLFTSFSLSTPLSSKYSRDLLVHESRDVLPLGFSLAGPAAPQTPLKLRIALAQNSPDAIVDALYSVSDPTSGKYRQHLSKSEVSSSALRMSKLSEATPCASLPSCACDNAIWVSATSRAHIGVPPSPMHGYRCPEC